MESTLLFSVIAGLAAITVTNIVKKQLGWSGGLALLATYIVAGVFALVYVGLQGNLWPIDFANLTIVLAEVFAVATAIYKFVVANQE